MPEIAPESNPLSRLELLQLAQSLGVSDADVMTRAELRTAIDKARRPAPIHTDQHPATWVSVARRLLASVVERGLNLPDAASLIRGDTKLNAPPKAPPPVATVTLARIYGAQGHFDRAIATLNEVLESDPDHELARDLRDQLAIRRTESLARAANATPIPPRDEPESAPGAASRVTPAERSNHTPKPSRLGTVNAFEGHEARPVAGLDPRAEAPSAEPHAHAATDAAEVAAALMADTPVVEDAQALADARPLENAPSPADSPLSALPPPFVEASASDPPLTEGTPEATRVDADAELVSPAFPSAPPSVRPPPFVDAPTSSDPVFNGAPPSAQPPPFVDAATGSDSAFNGAPPSAQPPAFVDAATGSDPVFNGAPPSAQPPPFVDTPASAKARESAPPGDDAPGLAPLPPAARIDPDAELVAPAFDGTDHAAHPIEGLTERPANPAFYTEPPTMVSTMALDRETPPDPGVYLEPEAPPTIAAEADPALLHDSEPFERAESEDRGASAAESAPDAAQTVEGASMAEPSAPELNASEPNTRADDAVSAERHAGSAPSNTEPLHEAIQALSASSTDPLHDTTLAIVEPTPAPLAAQGSPSHPRNGVSNGIQIGVDPLPVAAPLPPSPPAPKVAGLVLIETDTPVRYLYWELAASGMGAMHWIHIVTHTPHRGGIERHERRFPIHRQLGVIRLEGVPAGAVVRARLTQDADDARPLVVAGTVKPRARGAQAFEVRYTPHAHSRPEALATRAQPLLERASPVYWDR
jgi:hypothetical protein